MMLNVLQVLGVRLLMNGLSIKYCGLKQLLQEKGIQLNELQVNDVIDSSNLLDCGVLKIPLISHLPNPD
jgi:hypothetical protein